jgi:hypothetical protein
MACQPDPEAIAPLAQAIERGTALSSRFRGSIDPTVSRAGLVLLFQI